VAHNITSRDKVFSVREATWHGLADILDGYPTAAEAKQLVHPWEPVPEPVYRGLDIAALRERFQQIIFNAELSTAQALDKLVESASVYQDEIDGWKLNARNDDGHPLGVVSDTFELVNNQEMWDIAEAIGSGDSKGDVLYETGGSLGGGAKVWLLIRLAEPLQVNGDPRGMSIPYYALQNAHNGSGSFRGQATFTRIVCQNTAQMADLDAQARGTEFVFAHTSGIHERVEAAKEALAGWRASIETWQAFSDHMVSFAVTEREAEDFVQKFIPMPPGEIVSERVKENIEAARAQWRSAHDSVTNEGIRLTAHGLIQTSIEYSQHYRKRQNAESGFKRAYLDKSTLTHRAVELARSVSGA
jgi:phage/plasmid-like protein (TIGR03299 family)